MTAADIDPLPDPASLDFLHGRCCSCSGGVRRRMAITIMIRCPHWFRCYTLCREICLENWLHTV
jgi:hypothetical protein